MAGATGTPGNGISGGYTGHNATILRAMIAFTAIAWYNAIELIVLSLFVFKKYSGLYFWSMIITSFSIIPYALGAWMLQVHLTSILYLSVSFSTIGWMVMVTGESLVLYSRLHLVTQNEKLLRAVLWLIIVDAVLLYIPTAVLTFGSQSSDMDAFAPGYAVMEKIQMTLFSVQEFIISGVYLWEVRKILMVVYEGRTRNIMWQLVAINIAIIILDVALLTVEYLGLYEIETTVKGMVYSIKLKLEFGVLNKLVKIVTSKAGQKLVTSALDTDAIRLASPTPWQTGGYASSKSTTTDNAGSGALHLEYTTADALESHDWSKGSEVPILPLANFDEPNDPSKRRQSQQSSITRMYPGKLDDGCP